MEPVGFAIGVVGLAGPLAKASMDCYRIFDDMSDVGHSHASILHQLRTEGLRLKRWENAWGIGNGKNHQPKLDPTDYRYRYAIATLARIVAVFASVDVLQSKFGIVAKEEDGNSSQILGAGNPKGTKVRRRDRILEHRPFRWLPSSPPSAGTNDQMSIPTIGKNQLHALENPHILENRLVLPGLAEEISTMTEAIKNFQQSLPIYRKLCWVVSDKAELSQLLKTLRSLNDGLFNVLPTATGSGSPLSSQTPKPKLSFDIPFDPSNMPRKNPDFIDREIMINDFKREVETGKHAGGVVVLYGTGGVGKTQIALEYVYRYHAEYSSVFWVNAASKQTTHLGFTTIMQQLIDHQAELSDTPDYTHIGQLLKMTGKLDSAGKFTLQQHADDMHVIDAVKRWFTGKSNSKWLLVLDNLDDLESFKLNDYIPSCVHGTVIITSRRPESAQGGRRGFEIQEMQEYEAKSLLLKSAKRSLETGETAELEAEHQAAAKIVAKLGYLPLAVDQAGAFIHMRQYSFSRYLREYEIHVGQILSQGWKIEDRENSVFSTWELSFEAIHNQNPKAAELLLLCGFLNNVDICDELLRRGLGLPNDDTTLGESIQSLLSYSMAKRKDKDDSFTIHLLVHEWARRRLMIDSDTYARIANLAFLMATTAIHISPGEQRRVDQWRFEGRIMPHIIALEGHIQELKFGNETPEMIEGMRDLAVLYSSYRWFEKSLEWSKRHLAGCEKTLGPDHLGTLAAVRGMAWELWRQHSYGQALELYSRALAGFEKSLGPDHPDTLKAIRNIATTFHSQRKYSDALEWNRRALAGYEKSLGSHHPDTLCVVRTTANVFVDQGEYGDALEWQKRALAGFEKSLGPGHQDTLLAVGNIAMIFHRQGRYDDALEWYKRSFAGLQESLGPDHPDTVRAVGSIGRVFHDQGKYGDALEWSRRALAGFEKSFGPDHRYTLDVIQNIARVFHSQEKYDDALEYYQRVLNERHKQLGDIHPKTQQVLENLIDLYEHMGDCESAHTLRLRLSSNDA